MDSFEIPASRATTSIGRSSQEGETDQLLSSLTEETTGQVRAQLFALEGALGRSDAPARAPSLLDEVYRVAHGLRMSVDPERLPHVQRLAQLLQGVVKAVRAGLLPMRPELATLLSTVARITRESLDASQSGLAAPPPAEAAIEALQEMLARPGSWEPPSSLGATPPRFTRVETRRLRSAGDAARRAARAGESFNRAALDAGSMSARFREVMRKQEAAVRELREAIPRGLAAAARGEPVTEITAGLVVMLADVGRVPEELGSGLDGFAADMLNAAAEGTRATAAAETAARQLECVRVSSLLEGVPSRVKRSVKGFGVTAKVTVSVGDSEIESVHAELLRTALGACIRALTIPAPFTGKRLVTYSAPREAELALRARNAEGRLILKLTWTGEPPEEDHVLSVLAASRRHLREAGGGLEVDCAARGGASISVTLPAPLMQGQPSGEYIIVRAGQGAFAIPAAHVVEFIAEERIEARLAMAGKNAKPLRLDPSGNPHTGVVVRVDSEELVMLVDEIGGRETLVTGTDAAADAAVGIRANGASVPIVDAAALASREVPRTGGARHRPRARKKGNA